MIKFKQFLICIDVQNMLFHQEGDMEIYNAVPATGVRADDSLGETTRRSTALSFAP